MLRHVLLQELEVATNKLLKEHPELKNMNITEIMNPMENKKSIITNSSAEGSNNNE